LDSTAEFLINCGAIALEADTMLEKSAAST
jgi:hypothetical protein